MIKSMFRHQTVKHGRLVLPAALAAFTMIGIGSRAHAVHANSIQPTDTNAYQTQSASNIKTNMASSGNDDLVTSWGQAAQPSAASMQTVSKSTNQADVSSTFAPMSSQQSLQIQPEQANNSNTLAQSAASDINPQPNRGQASASSTQVTHIKTVMLHGLDEDFNPVKRPVKIMLTAKKPGSTASKPTSGKSGASKASSFSWPATVKASGHDGPPVRRGGRDWVLHDYHGVSIGGKNYTAYCDGWNQPGTGAGSIYKKIGQPPMSQQKALVYAYTHHFSHDVQDLICWFDSSEGQGRNPERNVGDLTGYGVPAQDVKEAHDAINKSGSINMDGWSFATYADRVDPSIHQQLTVAVHTGNSKTNTNTTGGGGTTSSSTSGSCGGGTAAAGAGGGGGGGAAGGAAAGGAAAGGGAAGGAATAGGAGGATDGTAGGVVGGGAGNNNSTPAGPNNNNILTAGGTQSSNNNPSNNNIVPETPVVNNNDHYSYTNGAGQPDNDYSSKLTTLAAEISQIGTNEGDELADMSDKDMNAKLALSQGHNERNMQLYQAEAQRNARIQGALDQSNARANVNDQLSDYQTGLSFQALRNRLSVTPANDNSEQILDSFNSQLNDILK